MFSSKVCRGGLLSFLSVGLGACIMSNSALMDVAKYSRIDDSLQQDSITHEIIITPEEATALMEKSSKTQFFSLETGLVDENFPSIQMAAMDAGNGAVSEKSVSKKMPERPDIVILFDKKIASVELHSGENTVQWPLEKQSVKAIYGLMHADLPIEHKNKDLYIKQAEKAATHPYVLVVADNQLLIIQSLFVQTEKTKTVFRDIHGASTGRTRTRYQYGYRTSIFPVDFSQITTEPLNDYIVVASTEAGIMLGRSIRYPSLWLLPQKDGAIDPDRFGYRIVTRQEQTGTSGIPRIAQIQTRSTIGLIS